VRAHYEREIQDLNAMLAHEIDMVRHNALAVLGVPVADPSHGIADDYIDDAQIDRAEVRIEEVCLKIIALHQPVADELRFLTTVIKTNHGLERIGDLLADIHELRIDHSTLDNDLGGDHGALLKLFSLVLRAVEGSIDCLLNRSGEDAREVWKHDRLVDEQCHHLLERLRTRLLSAPATPTLFDAINAVRCAERIADHSSSIAKEVLYLTTGEIVRHRKKELLGG